MLKVELRSLIDRLKKEIDYSPSLSELSKETGIHRTIISQLANSPAEKVATTHIDKLIQFAFKKLRTSYGRVVNKMNPNWDLTDEELMESLITTLIKAYPEEERFWRDVKDYFTEEEIKNRDQIPAERLWKFHSMAHRDDPSYDQLSVLGEEDPEKK